MPRTKRKIKCESCGISYNGRGMKKKKGKFYCSKCYLKQSKCTMPRLSENIPKSYLPPPLKPRKEKQKKKRFIFTREPNDPPKMKGEKKIITKTKKVHLFLTREEKNVLYKKFIQIMSSQDASERVKFISEKMSELAKRIKEEAEEKKLTGEQMQSKFLEGLEKYMEEEE